MMEPAHWIYRLPIIRHVRALWHSYRMNQHYEYYKRLGMLPVNANQDYEILDQIWRGKL